MFDLKSFFKFSIIITLFICAACTLKRPETRTPLESMTGVQKSLFATQVQNKSTGAMEWKGKKFMCGWAPIAEVGKYAKWYSTHNVIQSWHCSIVFTFNHDHSRLVGKLVNTSKPDDMNEWTTAFEIPIIRNYERKYKIDSYGRETNEIVEDSVKDHPSVRPLMDLDLQNITIRENAFSQSVPFPRPQSVEDVEINYDQGFLGFTIAYNDSSYGNLFEAKFRFNFLQMETNPNFESTPWHEKNGNHLNALHITGKKHNGISKTFMAAHWDKHKSHDVYLIGFPKKYYDIAVEVISDYNKLFREHISTKDDPITHDVFIAKNGDHLKNKFDLRYTSITWIPEVEKALSAPLGIGTALADPLTGEILWGGVTLWGGTLDYIVRSSAPNMDLSSSLPAHHGLNYLQEQKSSPFSFDANYRFPDRLSLGNHDDLQKKLSDVLMNKSLENNPLQTKIQNLKERLKSETNSEIRDQLQDEIAQLNHQYTANLNDNYGNISDFVNKHILNLENHHLNSIDEVNNYKLTNFFKSLIPTRNDNASFIIQDSNESEGYYNKKEEINKHFELAKSQHFSPICVISVRNIFSELLTAKESGNDFDPEVAMYSYIKEVIVHEFGHMIGLGHNMAENILPTVSAVTNLNIHPPRIKADELEDYNDTSKIKDLMRNDKTKYTVPEKYWRPMEIAAKKNMTNYSSVMGYPHTRTTILHKDHSKFVPGPHDVQVLRYLYNQEYATYKYGDDDFTYYKVPATGKIPLFAPNEVNDRKERFVSYFPSCTDWEATVDISPLCKRWDRGYDEETLVDDYLDSLKRLRNSKLIAKSELRGGRSSWRLENYLYGANLETMGRIRLFYDYMRDLFKEEIDSISHDVDAVKSFSTECLKDNNDDIENVELRRIFSENPKLKQLCKVNRKAVVELGKFMAMDGRDYSKIDYKNRTAPGGLNFGDASPSWKQYMGTYEILSDLPFKIVALNTLTLSQPYSYMYGWMIPMEQYSHDDGSFLYSSLYPKEYSEAIKNAFQENLDFTADGDKNNILKRTGLALGYFLRQGSWASSNDKFRFPKPTFLKKINEQTAFNFSYVAVLLNAVKMEGENAPPNRYKAFTATIYDFQSSKEFPAGEVYVLPDTSIIIKSFSNSIIYPISKMLFYKGDSAIVWAYRVTYDSDDNEELSSMSVKNIIKPMVDKALDACISGKDGKSKGLSHFFNKPINPNIAKPLEDPNEYVGFYIPPNIAKNASDQQDFKKSIRDNYERFINKYGDKTIEQTCFDALSGVGLTVSSAAALNGFWMPGMREFIKE